MDPSYRIRNSESADIIRITVAGWSPSTVWSKSINSRIRLPAPCGIPPAQRGDPRARDGDDGCELFGDLPEGDDLECMGASVQGAGQRDELENAGVLPLVNVQPLELDASMATLFDREMPKRNLHLRHVERVQ